MWLAMIAIAGCGRTALLPSSEFSAGTGRGDALAAPDLLQTADTSDASRSDASRAADTSSVRDTGPRDLSARDAAVDVLDAATDVRNAPVDALDAAADVRDAAVDVLEAASNARDAAADVRDVALDVLDAAGDARDATPDPLDARPSVVQLVLGQGVSCARLSDGTAVCWGNHNDGPGNSDAGLCNPGPVALPGLTGIVDLATDGDHSCAAFADGSVQCWGRNRYGDFGDGTQFDSDPPPVSVDARVTVVGLDHAVQLALGFGVSCARLTDGTASCWGGYFGMSPTPIAGLTGIARISSDGFNTVCAVLDSGIATCWAPGGTPVAVAGLNGVQQLSPGFNHSCALVNDGTVWCWGTNGEGQLGNGTQVGSATPVQVGGISGAKQVVVGNGHSCARLGDGTVWCWGYDFARERPGPNQYTTFTLQATQVAGLSGAQDIAAGTNHTCARLNDGSLWCWGEDFSGELGDGQSSVVCLPHDQPVIKRASFLFAGGDTSCVLDDNLGLACWGQVTQPPDRRSSPLTIALSQTPSPGTIAAGDDQICVVRTDHTVACWGNDLAGQLGDGLVVLYVDAQHPVTVIGLDQISDLSLGQAFSCALRLDGTVVCWGSDQYGQTANSSMNWPTLPNTIPGLANATAIQAGAGHVCAILADRTVACWGANYSGQLGPGETAVTRATPVAVPGLSGVVALAAGSDHTCALLDNQRVTCWGDDRQGQVGVATPSGATSITTPTPVPGLDHVAAIAAGQAHTCALITDGTVSCWGAGRSGELGDGVGTDRSSPAPVSGLTNVVQIALGRDHSCARLGDGTVRCWGGNDSGQVGAGFTPFKPTPVRVQGLP